MGPIQDVDIENYLIKTFSLFVISARCMIHTYMFTPIIAASSSHACMQEGALGYTALMFASQAGSLDIVSALLAAKADFNLQLENVR